MGSLSSSMASSMTTLSSSLTGSMGSLSSSMATSMNDLSSSMGSIMATTGSNLFKGNQTISGSIIPAVNGLYDLGSITNEFRDLYLSSASLYIDGTKVLGSTTQELTITTDTGQSFKILEAGSDTITLQAADGNITLATSGGGDVILDPTSGIIALKGTTTLYAGNKILSSDGNAIQIGNSVTMTGSLIVTGFIETQELRTTYISSSILYRSGSTKFGDELSDTHSFTGSLTVSGSISVPDSGLVSGSSQITYGGLSGVPSGIISGSAQLPSGLVSGSVQVLNGSGVFSGSAQLPSGIVSSSVQTIANLPSGTVSGSSQILNGTGFVKTSGVSITYDNSTYLTTGTASSTYQTILTNPVTGTGTTNRISKWTSTTALGDANITDNGSTVRVNTIPLVIDSRLGVGVDGGDQTYASIFVGGALTTGTAQYAIITDPQLAGTDNYALFANARIKASTAVTNTFGVYIPSAEKLSGASIVNNYALYIANQTAGSTTNYSIYSSGGLNYLGGATTFNSSVRAASLSMNTAPSADRMLYISANLPTTGASQFQSVMNGTFINAATTLYGMYVGNNTNVNVTNSYAIYIETTGGSGTITNKYGIYQASSGDKNYFAGNVGIGYIPTVALQVSGTIASGDGDGGWGRFLYDAGTVKIQASKNGTDAIGLSFWTQASGGAFSEKVSINGGGTLTTTNVGITNQNTYLGSGQLRVGGGLDHGSNTVLSIAPGVVKVDAPGVSGGRLNLDNSGNLTIGNNITAQGSLQVNTNGFSLKGWRQYAVQISAGGSTNTGAIILRQFQDSVNWNTGGVVVEIINYSYSHSEYDTRKDFARYGYSGNAATVNQINGNVTGKIPQPYWGSAIQGSGNLYYRDLKIDISPYHAYVISLTTPMGLNDNSTVGNGTIYLFS